MPRALVLALPFALVAAALPAPARAQAPRHATADGWDVDVWLGEADDTFTFQFRRGDETLLLSWETSFEHGEWNFTSNDPAMVTLGFERWLRSERAAMLTSPESFRDHALVQLSLLRASVEHSASTGGLSVCDSPHDPGRFVCVPTREGHAMMETCVHRAATDAERVEAVAATRAEVVRRARLIRSHYRAWFAAIRALTASP